MLTILAWMIFIPAAVWNIVFFSIAFAETISKGSIPWKSNENILHAIASLALLLIPGVYLFGFFKGYNDDETRTNRFCRNIACT